MGSAAALVAELPAQQAKGAPGAGGGCPSGPAFGGGARGGGPGAQAKGGPGGPGGPGGGAKGTGGRGSGRGQVDPAVQLERSALPGLKAAKISFFLAYAEFDPGMMGSFIRHFGGPAQYGRATTPP